MVCGGCGKRKGSSHAEKIADLRRFAFLSPRQLRLLAELEAAQKASQEGEEA